MPRARAMRRQFRACDASGALTPRAPSAQKPLQRAPLPYVPRTASGSAEASVASSLHLTIRRRRTPPPRYRSTCPADLRPPRSPPPLARLRRSPGCARLMPRPATPPPASVRSSWWVPPRAPRRKPARLSAPPATSCCSCRLGPRAPGCAQAPLRTRPGAPCAHLRHMHRVGLLKLGGERRGSLRIR